MKSPEVINTQWVSDQNIDCIAPFLPTAVRARLKLSGSPRFWKLNGYHAISIGLSGLPLGVLLLKTRGSLWDREAEVISFTVAQPLRRRGLGKELLDQTSNRLRRTGFQNLYLAYPAVQSCQLAMEKLISSSRGWKIIDNSTLYSCQAKMIPELIRELSPLYSSITDRYKAYCLSLSHIKPFSLQTAVAILKPPSWAIPRMNEQSQSGWGKLDSKASQVLYEGRRIVGWCICHKISSSAHRITIAYVDNNQAKRGLMTLPLLDSLQAIYSLIESNSNLSTYSILFGVRNSNQAMINFAERRLGRYIKHRTQSVECVLPLSKISEDLVIDPNRPEVY